MNLRKKGYLFSVLATLAFAATYIFSKYSLRYMDSVVLTLVWMSCGAIFCFAWSVARSGTRSIKLRRNYAWMVIGVGVLSAFAMVACFVSVNLLDPTVAALFGRLDLVFVVGISIVFLKERFNLMEGLGFAVVVAGILVMNWQTQQIMWAGFLWMVAACLVGAMSSVLSKACVEAAGPQALALYRCLAGVAVLLVYVVAAGKADELLHLYPPAVLSVAGGAFFGSFVGRLFFYESMRFIELSKVTVVTQLSPLFVAVMSLIFFRELPGVRQFIGGMVLLLGILILVPAGVKEGRSVVNIEPSESDAQEQPPVVSVRANDERETS